MNVVDFANIFGQLGADMFPRRLSVKFLLAGWLLGTFVLNKSYSGNLKSKITISKSIVINSLDDVEKSLGTRLLLHNGSPMVTKIWESFESDPLSPLGRLWMTSLYYKNLLPEMFVSFPNGTTKYAPLQEIEALKYDISYRLGIAESLKKSGKKIYIGKQIYLSEYNVLIFNKMVPKRILENVDYLVTRYFETAQSQPCYYHLDRSFAPFEFTGSDMFIDEVKAMSLDELSVIFHVWSCGIIVACLAMCLEMVAWFVVRKKKAVKRPHIGSETC